MSVLLAVLIIGLALLCEAFFAGSETGIISTNRIRLAARADRGDKRAVIIKNLLDNPERFLGTTLVGVNLSVIIGSSVATGLITRSLASTDYVAAITTAVMLPLILIFGEIVPKAIFRQFSETLSLWSAYPLKVAYIVLFPLVWLSTEFSSFASKWFVKEPAKKNPYVTREEMRILLGESAKQGFLDKEELSMAYEIFDFGKTDTRSIMVPLRDIASASDKSTRNELTELITKTGFSRIPIYKDDPANIIGTVRVSDLVSEGAPDAGIDTLVHRPHNVSEDKPIDELLKDFHQSEDNTAIVINKDGRAVGIVTLEDVIEEIVGEIEGEYSAKIESAPGSTS